jgi:alpha-1,6-mannosyltransferase
MLRQKRLDYTLFAISLGLYIFFAYGLARYETSWVLGTYSVLFALYLWISFSADDASLDFWIYASLLLRLSFLASLPNLSDDFYRFIWDGRLMANGYHPFAHLPSFYIETHNPAVDPQLFSKLNSPDYFTIYPPAAQFTFWLAAELSPGSITGSVLVLRVITLLAEFGNLWLIRKVLTSFQLPLKNVLLYALNPLAIIELTGNLHHEALLIFFVLLTIYLIARERTLPASIAYSLSICTKLIPLIFAPVLFFRQGWKRGSMFLITTAIVTLILFFPLLTRDLVNGFSQSIGYFYKKFEFNASLYYLWREWGFWYYGHNIIQSIAWRLGAIACASIIIYSYYRSGFRFVSQVKTFPGTSFTVKLPEDLMFIQFIYFLSTTTLHPWYILTTLVMSVFTPYRFVVIWTYLIFLTYSGYTANAFNENYAVVAIEYLVVLSYLFIELRNKKTLQIT